MKAKIDRNNEIVRRLRGGETYRSLSQEYKLAIATIQGIYNRWKFQELTKLARKNAGKQIG